MKTLEIDCLSCEDALNVVEKYSIIDSKWLILRGGHFRWRPVCSMYVSAEHNLGGQKVILNVRIPLFQKVVGALLDKYGDEAKKRLMQMAVAIKDQKLVKYLWMYLNEDSKTQLMARMLGAK